METNTVFSFRDCDGTESIGVILESDWDDVHRRNTYIVYSDNRILRMSTINLFDNGERIEADVTVDYVIVAYAILPDYDEKLGEFKK